MRPPIGSEFRLYFERTLGVGCGVGVLLALPAVVLALLFLLWSPALNLLSRRDLFGRLIRADQRQTSLVSSLGVLNGPQLNQRTKRTSRSVQATITPRINSRTPMIGRVRFIGNQISLSMLALWPKRRHSNRFNPKP